MKIETFFEKFELLINAPKAAAKLRELILQLAARGKLVHQYQSDEPASILIKRITAQRNILLQSEIKGEKLLPGISSQEVLHPIPSNWIWTRLGEVVNYSGAKKVSPDEIPENSWLLDLEDIEKDTSQIITRKTFGEKNSKSTKAKFKSSDILYGKLRPYLNKVLAADADGYCTTEIVPLQPYEGIILEYVMYILKRPDFLSYVNSRTYGINLPRLGTEDGRRAIFPLPPTEEQKRIVEKCDRLLSLCDQIEVRQQKRQENIVRMNESAIAQLLSSQNPKEFSQYWQRICNNFDLLYSIPETIPKLRQAILQLAVQGKLVPQALHDEPALVLLERIWTKKNQLVKKGKISKSKPSNLGVDQGFFELPQTWIWSKLDDIASLITDGEHATPPRTVEPGIPLGTAKNIRDGFLDFTTTDYVTSEVAKKCWKRCQPTHNDILMVCVGATTGRLCLLKDPPDFVIVRSVALIRPFENYIYPEYVALAIKSPLIQDQIWGNVKQSAQPCLYINRMQRLQIPIPPLVEQKRIVAKANRLMSLCDTLEAKLKEARSHSEKLMEVAAKQILIA